MKPYLCISRLKGSTLSRIAVIWLFATALLLTTMGAAVFAQTVPDVPELPRPDGHDQVEYHRVSRVFHLMRAQVERYGPRAPIFGPAGLSPDRFDPSGAGALLRFERLLNPSDIEKLRGLGIKISQDEHGVIHVSTIYEAFIRWHALEELETFPGLIRAEPTWRPNTLRPLEVTGPLTGAAQAQRRPLDGLDGSGVRVGTIDSMVDVLHPHFFHADGGVYDWVDVNGNGRFDPGVDGVDLTGDGHADATLWIEFGLTLQGNDLSPRTIFDPRFDWVYADLNGDEFRNAGADEGFFEDDLAYGEPIFVIDDANGNLALDVGEKLVRLGTSKIQSVLTDSATYERGQNLILAANDAAMDQAMHGTGVASILAGGQPPYHTRVGLAPGVDIINIATFDSEMQDFSRSSPFRGLREIEMRNGMLALHEWTDGYFVAQDGSTNFEAAMQEYRSRGMLQVNPLGNLNVSGKHVERDLNPGDPIELNFVVGEGFAWGPSQTLPYSVVYISLYYYDNQSAAFAVETPDGQIAFINGNGVTRTMVGASMVDAEVDTTPRGLRHLLMAIYSPDLMSTIEVGTWTLRIEEISSTGALHGRVFDYYSGWSVGVYWADPTVDRGTIVYPATADVAFGVAAFGGRHDHPNSAAGHLRGYSGRGPRIDGYIPMALAAPDDPFAAFPYYGPGYGRSWFVTFGGTSGAGPHVAAAMALLRQMDLEMSADRIEERLLSSAATQDLLPNLGPLPNEHWGDGKLDVHRAIYGESARDDTIDVSVVEVRASGEDLLVRVEATSTLQASVYYRVDPFHAGSFATEFVPVAETTTLALTDIDDGDYVARLFFASSLGAIESVLVPWQLDTRDEEEEEEEDEEEEEPVITTPTGNIKPAPGGCCAAADPTEQLPLAVILLFAAAWRARRRRV